MVKHFNYKFGTYIKHSSIWLLTFCGGKLWLIQHYFHINSVLILHLLWSQVNATKKKKKNVLLIVLYLKVW